MLDNSRLRTHHQGLLFGLRHLIFSNLFPPVPHAENCCKSPGQGWVVPSGLLSHTEEQTSFLCSFPEPFGQFWAHLAGYTVQQERWDSGTLLASFCCLLPMSLLIHHWPEEVSQMEAFGFSSVTPSFPIFSKVWRIVWPLFAMWASRWSDLVITVGKVGAKFFKGKTKKQHRESSAGRIQKERTIRNMAASV